MPVVMVYPHCGRLVLLFIPGRGPPRHRRARRRRCGTRRRPLGGSARTRRPALHPRRRRQRRERVARGQRFSQDLPGIEAYAPTDNVSELTARTNDEGWATVFAEWLKVSRLTPSDTVLVFSVGGGNVGEERQPEPGRARSIRQDGRRDDPRRRRPRRRLHGAVADACVIVPTVNAAHVTPHTEAFQAVVWHLLSRIPELKAAPDQVGVGGASRSRAGRLPRPRRRAQRRRWSSTATPHPPASRRARCDLARRRARGRSRRCGTSASAASS